MADAEAQVVPDGNAEEQGNSLFCLEFVSMNASSKAEKQQNRWVVRSTAMKNFRRRQLSQRTHTKEASRTNSEVRPHRSPKWSKEKKIRNKEVGAGHNEQHSDIKEESDQDLQEEPYPVVDEWIFETTSHGSWFERQAASGSHNEGLRDSEALYVESTPSYQILNGFFALPSPLNFLGGGRVDPFRRYPGEHVGTHVHELIDHCESQSRPESHLIIYAASHVTNADYHVKNSYICSMARPATSWRKRRSEPDFLSVAGKGHFKTPRHARHAIWRRSPHGRPSKSTSSP